MESQSTFLQRNQCKSQSRLFDQFYCNLRFHKGSDVQTVWRLSVATQFQSTLPRRERPGCRIFLKSYLDISIHAPTKGATNDYSKSSYSNSISIHALTKGATASWQFHLLRKIISIHAPTKGATAASTSDIYHEIISIHAPTKGATIPRFCRKVNSLFQSTLPRRERQNPSHTAQHHQHISIHAPTKGATQATQNAIGYVQFQSTLPRRERRSGFETK